MAKDSLETLISELTHEEDWRRMRATAACLAGGPRAVTGLIHVLDGGDSLLKIEATGLLARIKDPRAGVSLVKLLRHPDPAVCKAAVVALEQMAGVLGEDAAEALVQDLATADESRRKLLISLLGNLPNSIRPLCAMLKHCDGAVRVTASEILDHLLDARAADALIDAMGDPLLRDRVMVTLRKLRAIRDRIQETLDGLRDIEDSVEREEARMAAVMNLLGIGRPSVEILLEYLEDDEWVVREAAADLLGKIGDIRAVDPLMRRVREDNDTGVKEFAIKGLGLIGDARPVELLIEAIPIRPLRTLAMEALAKIKDVERIRPYSHVFEQLKSDRDGVVSYNANLITSKLEATAGESTAVEDAENE